VSFDIALHGPTREIYLPHTVKRRKLGTRLEYPDGRVFRYMRAGAANITIGRVIAPAAAPAAFDSDLALQEARTTAEWDDGDYTVRVVTTGSTSSTALNLTANQFAEGYLWVNDEAGEGQSFTIASHGAETTTGTTGGIDITVADESVLTVALTTASQVGLRYNIYDKVRIHTGTVAGGNAIGVAPVAVTANYYFWGQTWGPCPVMTAVLLPLTGDKVCVINSTGGSTGLVGVAGSVYPMYLSSTDASTDASTAIFTARAADAAPVVGYTLQRSSAKSEYSLIYLTISP
jgi:hypothetical protein